MSFPNLPSSPDSSSPPWGSTTKLIAGLTIVAVVAALLIRFREIIGPLILAFVFAYLLQPVAERFSQRSNIPWRTSVNLIYIMVVIVLSASLAGSGFAIIQQIQSLITFVDQFVTELPTLVENLSTQVFRLGPFELNFSQLNLGDLTNQLLGIVQTGLGQVTRLVSSFATSAVVTLGWILFVVLISYFLLSEAGDRSLNPINVPGYNADVRRLTAELRHIWNAFLRGQTIIFLLVMVAYSLLLMILGVRYAYVIALLAGLARFVPYIGPLIVWITLALVAFFQGSNYYGLQPFQFALLAVVAGLILDQIFDNLVVPRFLGQTLGVHPAAVMVAAIVATNLIGIIGLVLAAPVLATITLLGKYVIRKMFDLDPWPEPALPGETGELPWTRTTRRLRAWWRAIQKRS